MIKSIIYYKKNTKRPMAKSLKFAFLTCQDPHAINRSVTKWQRLLELIKILEASLRDIQDRWADGKGPLAHEFTAIQVKQLIRALFQNTERRAALLTTIK